MARITLNQLILNLVFTQQYTETFAKHFPTKLQVGKVNKV